LSIFHYTIGTNPYDGNPTFLHDTLDEIKIYNIALSADQIVVDKGNAGSNSLVAFCEPL
jgi:hypothetical protein